MAWYDFIFNFPGLNDRQSALVYATLAWVVVILIIVIVWIITSRRRSKGTDISALAALASSDATSPDTAANADPKEVMAILSIERISASTALTAVKDARKGKRISARVADSLAGRYKARIAKIDGDMKKRTGAQEYQSLAQSLEQTRDRLRGEVTPKSPGLPPPPTSGTPGIPPTAPPVPGSKTPPPPGPSTGIPSVPTLPKSSGPPSGPPSMGSPPTKPASPIPTPPKIPAIGPSGAKPTTVVPPSVAPPTISTPPLPPKLPTSAPVAPPTTGDLAPPPVPTTAAPTAAAPASSDSDPNTISGLRMEMLRELARLKKFMSEETQ
ncbi:MAG: hypothetical protein FK733_05560 [Asgard group archaeon]|nr:hypothetical protein [Asgard group archaeon]